MELGCMVSRKPHAAGLVAKIPFRTNPVRRWLIRPVGDTDWLSHENMIPKLLDPWPPLIHHTVN